jgi:hypothetical protein
MSERRRDQDAGGGGVFNIGSQQAGVINNVAGDQRISGGQHGTASFGVTEALEQLDRLRVEIQRLELPEAERGQALGAIDAAQAELREPEPDRRRTAGHLERLVGILRQTGALLTAGAAVVGPLQSLAAFLGPFGASLAALLAL